jgi:prepilin-type N-terminal cleavage/methylation domain-containing protein
MKVRHPKFGGAFTLIEVMLSIFILSVALLGASGYRYYATLDAEKADAHIEAARVGLLICESWRGMGGSETYDPTAHLSSDLPITVPSGADDYDFTGESGQGPEPQGHALLGRYKVALNKGTCYPTLSYKDTGTGLRILNVVVAWPQRGYAEGDTGNAYWAPSARTYKLFKLTTYVSD